MKQVMKQDRRKNTRVKLSMPVRVFCDEDSEEADDAIHGWLQDISLGGLFILTGDVADIGDTCRLEVVLYEPDDPINIWLEGDVVRREKKGFAVHITSFHQRSFARLRDLLLYGGQGAEESMGLSMRP